VPRPDQLPDWAAWGDERPALSRPARRFLARELDGLPRRTSKPAALADASLPPSMLAPAARHRLAAAVGDAHVRTDREARLRHAGGQAYVDLLRRRAGTIAAPDAVVSPADAAGVLAVLRVAAEQRIAVVPYGGGTSVVGGVEALRGGFDAAITLDLSRLDRLRASGAVIDVDPISLTASMPAGMLAPAAEAALARHGLTLGHFPQSFERASIGGFVATRSAGQASCGYGRIDDLVVGLRLATPEGEITLPAQPGSAAGPDLRRLVLGSEGAFGVVTEVTLRVHPAPASKHYRGWMLPSYDAGLDVLRTLAQRGPLPTILRLSDPEETRIGLRLSGPGRLARAALDRYLALRGIGGGCLLIAGFEGEPAEMRHRRRGVGRALRRAGAVSLGSSAGNAWEHGRFGAPYLRDTLLDTGVLAETLETATTWSRLKELYGAVDTALRDALAADGSRPLVGCHVSHVYPTGASLYFTVLARQRSGAEVEQWERAKEAAMRAIVGAGGTASHHHGVGATHAPYLAAEDSALGVQALRAVKERLDPIGILNPGKLLG
jgi:alkyldihydroxyacetonephosphate synthase